MYRPHPSYSFVHPKRLWGMGPEHPVKLRVDRVAAVLGGEGAPAVLEVEPEPEELTKVIGRIGSCTAAPQRGIEERPGVVPTNSCVGAAVELRLPEHGVAER